MSHGRITHRSMSPSPPCTPSRPPGWFPPFFARPALLPISIPRRRRSPHRPRKHHTAYSGPTPLSSTRHSPTPLCTPRYSTPPPPTHASTLFHFSPGGCTNESFPLLGVTTNDDGGDTRQTVCNTNHSTTRRLRPSPRRKDSASGAWNRWERVCGRHIWRPMRRVVLTRSTRTLPNF